MKKLALSSLISHVAIYLCHI